MDVENRQQCQLMNELQHRPGPNMRVRVAAVALQQTPSPWFLQHMRHIEQGVGK